MKNKIHFQKEHPHKHKFILRTTLSVIHELHLPLQTCHIWQVNIICTAIVNHYSQLCKYLNTHYLSSFFESHLPLPTCHI